MTDRWFRFYDAVPDDPKILRLSEKQFRWWAFLLCIASRSGGEIPKDMEDAAITLRVTVTKAIGIMSEMVSKNLFEETETGFQPHNWNGRQWKNDVSTERVKRFRERHAKRDETVSETSPEYRVQNTETETDSSLRSERAREDPPPVDRPPKRKSKIQLPRDCPDDAAVSWAHQFWEEHTRSDLSRSITEQIDQFRDHHTKLANAFADWSAAWRTWARNALKDGKNGNGNRLSAHDKGTLGAAMWLAETEDDQAGIRGRNGTPVARISPNGHDAVEVENPLRNVLGGPEPPIAGSIPRRLQEIPHERGEPLFPDTRDAAGGVRKR